MDFYINFDDLAKFMSECPNSKAIFHSHYYDVTTTVNDFQNLEEEQELTITHDEVKCSVLNGEEVYIHGLSLANYTTRLTPFGTLVTEMSRLDSGCVIVKVNLTDDLIES